MIAVDQTFFGTDEDGSTPGNCTQAVLASLLELPLEQVPHIALFDEYWKLAIVLWLRIRGKGMRVFTDDPEAAEDWQRQGVETAAMNRAPSGQMMIATGQSHSGPWRHVVLWKAGTLVHDTNPQRLGIKGPPIQFWQITDAVML